MALLCFNVGVEIGQLMFVAVILATMALFRSFMKVPRTAIVAAAYNIGIVAAYWTLERIHAMLV